jgi:hypothetical protein
MLQAFTLLNKAKLKSQLTTVGKPFTICLSSSVPLTQASSTSFYNKKSARQQRGAYRPDPQAWPRCRSRSLHDKSASSSKQPRSKIIKRHIVPLGRLQKNPVSAAHIAT